MEELKIVVGLVLAAILFLISCIHIYWVLGGRWGISGAIPTRDSKPLFRQKTVTTILVAFALLIAVIFILGRIGFLIKLAIPTSIFHYGIWGITVIFFIRAVGDFKYVGFFKKVRDSKFAYWDTRFHSPLCLFISISSLIII